jgi:endonuclease-3 related protein
VIELDTLFAELLGHFGPQSWWPAQTRFEMLIGAVLTQNTAWRNVERAIAQLRLADRLSGQGLLDCPPLELAQLIRPAGYYNVKTRRLLALCRWFVDAGGFEALEEWPTARLRTALLAVHGVGKETADSILLYGFARPIFVVDAYTQRLFTRLGLIPAPLDYDELRCKVEAELTAADKVAAYNELHALIVVHGKDICRPRPRCSQCLLIRQCDFARAAQLPLGQMGDFHERIER